MDEGLPEMRHQCPNCGDEFILTGAQSLKAFGVRECHACRAVVRHRRLRSHLNLFCLILGFLAVMIVSLLWRRPWIAVTAVLLIGCVILLVQDYAVALEPLEVFRQAHECRTCGYDVHACEGERCPECGTPLPAHLAKGPPETGEGVGR